jgi:hypothetical protein
MEERLQRQILKGTPRVPTIESMSPSRDPLSDSPGANWHLRLASGGQYGPQSSEIMRQWLNEGRITADSLVWRDGWADWKPAGSVFPSLSAARPMAAPMGAAPGMMPAGMAPRPGYAPGMAPGGMAPAGYGYPAGAPAGYGQQEEEANEFDVSSNGSSSSGGGGGGGGGYAPPRRDNTLIQASMIVLVLALVVLVPLMIWALTNQPVVDRNAPPLPKVKTVIKQQQPGTNPPKTRPPKSGGEEKMRL